MVGYATGSSKKKRPNTLLDSSLHFYLFRQLILYNITTYEIECQE